MSYKKATQVLPQELLEQVQEYGDGEYLYIPRITENKKDWGSETKTRQFYIDRNLEICRKYKSGVSVKMLAEEYALSVKSIQRIIRNTKQKDDTVS